MHSLAELGAGVPAFLGKLWKLVEDKETDDLICWAPNGRSFFIKNQARFARELLPHYYKHNNMASFVRQLNMYGFHKKVSVELGGLRCDRDEMEFAHQYFCKGHPYLLDHIKRKIASNKAQDATQTPIKPELMTKMLTEVRSMRGRQEQFDSRLGNMKRENEALWRELALLRQKHLKQQQIVNKLIHFLVSLVQPNRNSGLAVKRRYPLMINDRQHSKQPRKMNKPQPSPSGPAIHELETSDAELDNDYMVAEMLDSEQPTVESPEHPGISEDISEDVSYDDEVISIPNEIHMLESKRIHKRKSKGNKKGRKNKVPVKIYIPTTENGDDLREETIMMDMPSRSPTANIIVNNKPSSSKPVPMATLRSSKLAAMARNMKSIESDPDPELEYLDDDNNKSEEDDDDNVNNLDDILIVPDVLADQVRVRGNTLSPGGISSLSSEGRNSASPEIQIRTATTPNAGTFGNLDFSGNSNRTGLNMGSQVGQFEDQEGRNLSLTSVMNNGPNECDYRLGAKDEVDTHLETMQSDLENLREVLRGEGYSIDANTLLGVSSNPWFDHTELLDDFLYRRGRELFGGDDPMAFGIPVNPDLDPHSNMEKSSVSPNGNQLSDKKSEMVAYSAPSFPDLDDDMFLDNSSNQLPDITDITYDRKDPELLFDSLISSNGNQ